MTTTTRISEPPAAPHRMSVAVSRVLQWEGLGLFAVLVALFVVLSFIAPNFLSVGNMFFLVQQAAFFGIVALAATLVIVSGEIDISVGSHAALSSAMLGVFVVEFGVPMWLACLMVIAAAIVIGAFAGWVRAKFDVPSFIVTLALYLALRGLALMITDATSIPIPRDQFFFWGTGRLFDLIPVSALYMAGYLILTFALIAFIATRTRFGRSIYAVGGNATAAQLSGINISQVRIAVFVISGLSAAAIGILQTAQLSAGTPSIAVGLEFDAIAAAIIGGAALSGGKGTISGTMIGVFFIAVLLNGMVLLGVDQYAQQVVRGGIVLAAVLISVYRQKSSKPRFS